jgi:hypothetical protein
MAASLGRTSMTASAVRMSRCRRHDFFDRRPRHVSGRCAGWREAGTRTELRCHELFEQFGRTPFLDVRRALDREIGYERPGTSTRGGQSPVYVR